MQINLRDNLKIHNRYDVRIVNKDTGQVVRKGTAFNTITQGFWQIALSQITTSGTGVGRVLLRQIALGNGTGNPSYSDTALFNQTHYIQCSSSNVTINEMVEDYPTSRYNYTAIFPATTSYVGDFTEIGIFSYSSGGNTSGSIMPLVSHALFKDSEGNPITITKTSDEIMYVDITMYLNFGSAGGNFTWFEPGPINTFSRFFRVPLTADYNLLGSSSYSSSSSSSSSYSSPPYSSYPFNRYLSALSSCNHSAKGINFYGYDSLGNAQNYTRDVSTRTFGSGVRRLTTEQVNDYYIHGIVFTNVGGVLFPNAEIFPNQEIKDLSIGTGDGVTTGFDKPLDYFIANSDKVYVNDVLQTRGVDYTINNESSSRRDVMFSQFLNLVSNGKPGGTIGSTLINAYSIRKPFFRRVEETEVTYWYSPFYHPYESWRMTTDMDDVVNSTAPLILEISACAPVKKFNHIQIILGAALPGTSTPQWYNSSYTPLSIKETVDSDWTLIAQGAAALEGVYLKVETSMNGSSWTEFKTLELNQITLYSNSTGTSNAEWLAELKGAVTTCNYVRFTLDKTQATNETIKNAYAVAIVTPTRLRGLDVNITTDTLNRIDYVLDGKPINFTTPPPEGAIIKMDCSLDRPYKTDQFVIDAELTLTF